MRNKFCAALAATSGLTLGLACAGAAATEEESLEEVVVLGRAQESYRAEQTALGTKVPMNVLDVPQSIQVLNEQLIRDQAARQVTDLYRSISGVTMFSYSGVTFRGFRQDEVRYDGVRGDPFTDFAIPQLFNIERVEVLKGPSGMLYGSGEPGGLINYVTKKPSFDAAGEAALFSGRYDLRGASVEWSGPFPGSERAAYRVGGLYEQRDFFRNNADSDNLIADGAVTFKLGAVSDFTLQYFHVTQELGGHRLRGVPVDDRGEFLTDISFNTNEPGDYQDLRANVVQARLRHRFKEGVTGNFTVRWFDNEAGQKYHEARAMLDFGGITYVTREYRDQLRENSELSLTADLVIDGNLFGLEHTVLVGADWFDSRSDFIYLLARPATVLNPTNGGVPPLRFHDPIYGADTSRYAKQLSSSTLTDRNAYGLYVQEQLQLGSRWQLIAGARYDGFDDRALNRIADTAAEFDDGSVQLRGGVVYELANSASLYASYSEGFAPQTLTTQENGDGPFDPQRSSQVELGAKAEWFDGRLLATTAVYEIVKQNVVVGNPDPNAGQNGVPLSVAIGEATSRGFELDFVGDLTHFWTVTLGYAYNDVEITRGAPGSLTNSVGKRFANAPRHELGVWTRFALRPLSSSLAFGMDYVGERISLEGQRVKSYTIFDMSWQTELEPWLLQLNVKNLLDKEYAESGFIARTGHFPGEPRMLIAQISRRF